MIIHNIEIRNFRSYYGDNKFEFIDSLNLIIGANGDGKTTLFEALEWLFRTDNSKKVDERYISKKKEEELLPGESDNIYVSMSYEHGGLNKTLKKEFRFTKTNDENVTMQNYAFTLTNENGVERETVDGSYFDRDLPSDLRRYIMFKGESELDVFQQSNALKMLIDTFSDVKDFEAYSKFMQYATDASAKARDNQQKLNKQKSDKVHKFRRIIEEETGILSSINKEIDSKSEETVNFTSLLKSIEDNKEAAEELVKVNNRIESLSRQRAEVASRIHEDYTINLLDDMWILMGFDKLAEEFSQKVSDADKKRRQLEQDYLVKFGERKALKKLKFVPLPANIPGPDTMREMLDEEVCKVCGRPAPKHSEPWEFMLHKLQEYEETLKKNEQTSESEDVPPMYTNNYIKELNDRLTTLRNELPRITALRRTIQEKIALNNRLHNDLKKIEQNLDQSFEEKKRILAQADGLTEDQLKANFQKISNWFDEKNRAEKRLDVLKQQREMHRAKLEEAQDELSKLAEGTSAAIYAKIWRVFQQISDAFTSAKDENKNRLIQNIEDTANNYLAALNANDFKGTVRIISKTNGQAEAILANNDGSRILNPNTALRTTYLLSVIFAIGNLSSKRNNSPYPLIFDAPTSSFTDAKDAEFFNVVSSLDKQVIIVTKSFLRDEKNGNVSLDSDRIENVKGRVYRIEKKKPFDDKKLGTIQTVITKIK